MSTSRRRAFRKSIMICLKRHRLVLVVGTVLAGATAGNATAAQPVKQCGEIVASTWRKPGTTNYLGNQYLVLASGLSCSSARKLAARGTTHGENVRPPGPSGWKCSWAGRKADPLSTAGVCTKNGKRIRQKSGQWYGWAPDYSQPPIVTHQ
jgi:hypothetical protein